MSKKIKKEIPKTRFHRVLFDTETAYGHRVEKDKTKVIPRKEKYKDQEKND
tara:strand:+ start:27942 stop:28094 length:153 start_codon:yes stop_codon:yes gene_type:complete